MNDLNVIDEDDLDPHSPSEWAAFARAAQLIVERVLARYARLRDEPAFCALPEAQRRELSEAPPAVGGGIEVAVREALSLIEPYGTGNLSPRFWGWVLGGGNLAGMLGQWLAASMNANVFAGAQGPVELERAVLDWFRVWFEFPPSSSGLLLDGASSANQLGLCVARHWATEGRVKREGMAAAPGLRVYASQAVHNSVHKAAVLLGLGSGAVHSVATRADDSMDPSALEAAIEGDRRAGYVPFCVVASAGTVGIGAIDPLVSLHALCRRERLWLHVDGAIGALGFLAPALRPRLAGLELADSLAFDLHKWGQIPYDAGCLLVRDGALHAATFELPAAYLATLPGGLMPHDSHAFNRLTPNLSRADRALKIWLSFRAFGTLRMQRVFEQSVAQAQYLAGQVAAHPRFRLLHQPALNIVCFRYRAREDDAAAGDALHERALVALQSSGFAVLSPFVREGRLCFRVVLSNHRTRRADLDALLAELCRLG